MPSDRLATRIIFILWRVLSSKYRQTGSAAARDDNILRTVSYIICIIILYTPRNLGLAKTHFLLFTHTRLETDENSNARAV